MSQDWYRLEEHLVASGLDADARRLAAELLERSGDPRAAAVLVADAAGEDRTLDGLAAALERFAAAAVAAPADEVGDALERLGCPSGGRAARGDRLQVVRRLAGTKRADGRTVGEDAGTTDRRDVAAAERCLAALDEAAAAAGDASAEARASALVEPLRRLVREGGPASLAAAPPPSGEGDESDDGGGAFDPDASGPPRSIRSSADVAAVLDAACAWYAAHEPSSPVPVLLGRARALVDATFAEVLAGFAETRDIGVLSVPVRGAGDDEAGRGR